MTRHIADRDTYRHADPMRLSCRSLHHFESTDVGQGLQRRGLRHRLFGKKGKEVGAHQHISPVLRHPHGVA